MDFCDTLRVDHVLYQCNADERLFMDVSDNLVHHPVYQNESMADASYADAVRDDPQHTAHFCRNACPAVPSKCISKLSGCFPPNHYPVSGDEPAAFDTDLCFFE